MRIVQITPGSGDNFYCENCLRDLHMVKTMRKLGHDVIMVPLYLPIGSGEQEPISDVPIFYGGGNVYLQQKMGLFRKTPRWLDRVFDSRKLLSWVSKKTGMTSPKDLGETTLSMLRGEHGRQVKELGRLVTWLCEQEQRPDIVCLSNILLVGLARQIQEQLDVPVVCLLQDEEGFLDGLVSPYAEQAWSEVVERSKGIDGFVSVSDYYAGVMKERLGIADDRMHVVHIGIATDGYDVVEERPEVPTIGYLSRMCPARGLDLLVDAFIELKKRSGLEKARLRITGGKIDSDDEYVDSVRNKLESHGLLDDVDFLLDFHHGTVRDFLTTLSVLSVPDREAVAYGLYVLEALASGVPVVQPRIGVFPELLEATGGGVLYEPNDVETLAGTLEKVLLDVDLASELGRCGRESVVAKFDIQRTSEELARVYDSIVQRYR